MSDEGWDDHLSSRGGWISRATFFRKLFDPVGARRLVKEFRINGGIELDGFDANAGDVGISLEVINPQRGLDAIEILKEVETILFLPVGDFHRKPCLRIEVDGDLFRRTILQEEGDLHPHAALSEPQLLLAEMPEFVPGLRQLPRMMVSILRRRPRKN